MKRSLKIIKGIVKSLVRQTGRSLYAAGWMIKKGAVSVNLFGRKFIFCMLEKLPVLKQRILLDNGINSRASSLRVDIF